MNKITFVALILFPAMVLATSRATPEQILCTSSRIVKAKVVSAAVPNCTPYFTEYDECSQGPLVPLSVQVIKVIAQKGDDANGNLPIENLAEGGLVNVITHSINRIPTPIGGIEWPPMEVPGSMTIRPPTGKPLTQRQVTEAFEGKEFIFAIAHFEWDTKDKPMYASIWPAEKEQWVYNALRNPEWSCPQLLE